ncbi:hypothetical protein JW898_00690 [Candidatus Woesearchaeota archaeon]|nr:hypothetical protein [Candidatus Woesearchaeota archaeon]
MFKNILGGKEKRRVLPRHEKENFSKQVSAQRFNEMIDYYTAELKSRLAEIDALKAENEMLVKTSLKNASRSDELRLQLQKLQEDMRVLQQRLSADRPVKRQ